MKVAGRTETLPEDTDPIFMLPSFSQLTSVSFSNTQSLLLHEHTDGQASKDDQRQGTCYTIFRGNKGTAKG